MRLSVRRMHPRGATRSRTPRTEGPSPPPYHGPSQATGGNRSQRVSLVFAVSRAGRLAADWHRLQPRGSIKAPSSLSKLATRRSVYAGNVPGASEEARRVKIMNANWIAGADGDDGDFELMIVTSDDRQHVVAPSPAAMIALVALAQADTVLVWDPADRRLIAANLRGTMAWTKDPARPGT